ncbi:MAG: ClbS/DfsB family four-helix bundle protein [Pseudomonadota bacterium]
MAIPVSKPELLSAIDTRFRRLEAALDDVPSELVGQCSMDGHAKGTMMSPSNLLAYLIGWHLLVLKWLEHDASGQPIDFPDDGYKWNELGALAQRFYADHVKLTFDQKRVLLRNTNAEILADMERRTNDQLYGQLWYKKYTMGRMIQLNTASPYENARMRLRKWVKSLPDT